MANYPGARHGLICARVTHALMSYLETHDLGRVLCNNSGVVTEREPHTVRGPDVSYYSYQRVPKEEPMPGGFAHESPEVVFHVLLPSDHWKELLAMVNDYHRAHVMLVYAFDTRHDNVVIFHPNQPEQTLKLEDDLWVPGILPDFSVPVRQLLS